MATAIGLLSLSAASCVYWPFAQAAAEPPLTPPLEGPAAAADVAGAVREAPPLVASVEPGDPAILLPVDPSTDTSSGEYTPPVPDDSPLEPLREGEWITRRTGQLAATGDGRWRFVFDVAGEARPLPAMIVLPNALLEAMERQVAAGEAPTVFDVTGEVTRYRGEAYLVIRRAVVVRSVDLEG